MLRRRKLLLLLTCSVVVFLAVVFYLRSFTVQSVGRASRRYSIISCSVTGSLNEQHYCFYVPITILAWKRIGYNSIVVVVRMKGVPADKASLKAIEVARGLGALVVETEVENERKDVVRLFAMVSRLYAGAIESIDDNDFVLTSDSDLLPVNMTVYEFDFEYVNIMNANCCGDFKHLMKTYKMYPIGNIGMKKKQWRMIMKLGRWFHFTPRKILDDVKSEFRTVVNMSAELKGGNDLWFIDQKLISMRLASFKERNPQVGVRMFDYKNSRLDRSVGETLWAEVNQYDLPRIIDCHLIASPGIFKRWNLVDNILKITFSEKDYDFIRSYYKEYKLLASFEL